MISAFTVQLPHEIDLVIDSWQLDLGNFSSSLPKLGNLKLHVFFYDMKALIYCDLITPQFVSHSKV
jgi:hypothetical protein